jgi:hypothetical protein
LEEEEVCEESQWSNGKVLDVVNDIAMPRNDECWLGLTFHATEYLEGCEYPHTGKIGGHDHMYNIVWSGEEFV